MWTVNVPHMMNKFMLGLSSSSELPDTSNLEEFVGKDIGQYKSDPDKSSREE